MLVIINVFLIMTLEFITLPSNSFGYSRFIDETSAERNKVIYQKMFFNLSSSPRSIREATISFDEEQSLSCLPLENTTDKVIDIAVLVPRSEPEDYTPCSRDYVIPVVHLAVAHLMDREMKGPLQGWNITIHYRDTNCSSTFGPLAAVDLFLTGKADVFLGPVCEYALAPVSRFATVWDTPVLTPGGHPQAFNFKENYPTLTRLRGFDTEVSRVFKSISEYFDWKLIGLLYEDKADSEGHSTCHMTLSGVHDAFNKTSAHIGFVQGRDDLKDFINYFTDKARIIFLCAQNASIIREIMLISHSYGMTNGEYAFFNIHLFARNVTHYRPWFDPKDSPERNEEAKEAFKSLLTITARVPDDPEYHNFTQEVYELARERFDFNYTDDDRESLSPYLASFYDAVIVYARALNATLAVNNTIHNGTLISQNMWNHTFTNLITGNVSINSNGDRNAGYSILDLNEEDDEGAFTVVGVYMAERLNITQKIFWPGDAPPKDRPKCGFQGELCHSYLFLLVIGILCLLVVILLAFSVFIYRHYKLEADIARMTWKINWQDVHDITQGPNKMKSKFGSRLSIRSTQSNVSGDSFGLIGQIFIRTGHYKGMRVAIKRFKCPKIDLNRPLLLELKQMKDLQSEHLVRFVGACVEEPCYGLFTEYCPRGSLQDVLEDEHFQLDSMFRYSLMHDIVKGMSFLHSSELRFHGNLKSTNCVVDSRFVLKLTDFGLHSLRALLEDLSSLEDYAYWRRKLWTAPEKLRCGKQFLGEATQKADVYSFAIIVHEISFRKGPFYTMASSLEPFQIVENVRNGGKPPFRPSVDDAAIEEEVLQMMKRCWAEDPLDRPDFRHLKGLVRKLNKNNDSGNILDNLLSRMEQYANNLETLVQERTADYLEEKRRCEELLYQLLPRSVAGQLISGETVMAETYDNVTIYFSDIVGFTSLSAQSTPMEVVELLNDLYSTFDYIIENFNVYKVETIGDAYMVVSGLPDRNGNLHAREIARMSLRLLDTVRHFVIRHRPKDKLHLRIGMHTGPCVAGIVGVKMPRYCLFGDTVNTASRMESNGLPLRIHVSPTTGEILLRDFPSFNLELRGEVILKGKGSMTTYWLLGEDTTGEEEITPSSPHSLSFPGVEDTKDFISVEDNVDNRSKDIAQVFPTNLVQEGGEAITMTAAAPSQVVKKSPITDAEPPDSSSAPLIKNSVIW